jgi:hypothetical protein
MVEGLVTARPHLFGDRRQPLLGVREHRVDVEDHAAKGVDAMLHHLADGELGATHGRRGERRGRSLIDGFHRQSIAPNRPVGNAVGTPDSTADCKNT